MVLAANSIDGLPSREDTLRVTTFNILAPVWTNASIYPGMDMSEFDASTRRRHILASMKHLDSDVVFLQECQKTELEALLAAEDGYLASVYDVDFCPFPLTFWTNWLQYKQEAQQTGVCVLTKRGVLIKLGSKHMPVDLPEWEGRLPQHALGAHACTVEVEVPRWGGAKALLVTAHLDADSAYRAGLQCEAIAKRLQERSDEFEYVIWGGDFNMEARSAAFKRVARLGFRCVSGATDVPTVYAVPATVRVDHILARGPARADGAGEGPRDHDEQLQPAGAREERRPGLPRRGSGPLECEGTYIPRCPLGHMFPVLPFLTELQWICCSARGDRGGCVQGLVCALLAVMFPLLPCGLLPVLACQLDRSRQCKRLSWALENWGSDHLPVTVSLRPKSASGVPPCGTTGL